jgi:two-component system, chemotaxis family, chemotaxis protein CheY
MGDIYLIDDDVLVNYLNREMIQAMAPNYQIKTFELATNALDVLLKKVEQKEFSFPQWIFLDINMPFMDGWEFLSHYAQIPANYRENTKLCLLSSSIDLNDTERSAANPLVMEYLIKPLNEEQLDRIGLSIVE